jgi:heterodisulfide reductase subunit C
MAEGEDLHRCLQCGTCSSACPAAVYMDFTPRKVIAMTRAGMEEDVLTSNTIWLCMSCYACSVACPKEIKVTEVMYALKRMAIEKHRHPKWLPVPVLAKEFFRAVWKTGRSNETWTVTRTFLRTNPLKLVSNAFMGLRLMLRGRMSPKIESMKGDKGRLHRLMEGVRRISEAR